ncbi:Disease resistance protein RPS2 [Senna tora]|uniref:Disease resistance protein RPS2 n=1 Tax=Senna tora TaxID=362788 RepID=A0A834XFF2_9FABA|nr:Disease resistance protein RPS2 [Senna tora]
MIAAFFLQLWTSRTLVSEAAASNRIAYSEATTLVFENLDSLVSFRWDDRPIQWPSLENITVSNCAAIKDSGLGNADLSQLKSMKVILQDKEEDNPEIKISKYFDLSDKFEKIQQFEINGAEELSKTLAMKLKPYHFQQLLQFQAKNCDERLNSFLSILLERSKQLKDLIIKENKSIKRVFDCHTLTKPDSRGNGIYLPDLETLTLWELPQLNCIWNEDPTGIFGLDHLKKISILKCSSLKNVISVSAAEKLQGLQVLKLYSCEKVEVVVAMENQGVETQKRVIKFPLLRDLVLVNLSNLLKFHNGNCALEFPALEKLRINNCPQMIAFTTGFASAGEPSTTDNGSTLDKLNELEVVKCGQLDYIIPCNILTKFQNLKKLTISNCNSLKELFPFDSEFHSVEPILPELSHLVLTLLPSLLHVINRKFENTRFFKHLQILQLKDCNSLEYLFLPFVAGSLVLREIEVSDCKNLEKIFLTKEDIKSMIQFPNLNFIALENLPKLFTFCPGTFDFPSLERLKVVNCPALKTFVSMFDERKDLLVSSNNCFFNFELLKNLKKFHIRNQDGSEKLLHEDLPSETFCELEKLSVIEINNLLNVVPSSMLIRYKKLDKMTVQGCKLLKEVFDLVEVLDNADEMLPQLSELILNKLPNLVCVWNREPQVPVFQNLASLQIIDCGNLKRLFSLSTAKYLQKLKTLKLYGCKDMEEVLFEDEVGLTNPTSSKINFPMVERLILKDLPKLASFCRYSYTFEWPKLRTVRMSKIPEMKMFSQGIQSTPSLRAVYVTFIKKCWQGDLNNTIKYLHNNPECRTETDRKSCLKHCIDCIM